MAANAGAADLNFIVVPLMDWRDGRMILIQFEPDKQSRGQRSSSAIRRTECRRKKMDAADAAGARPKMPDRGKIVDVAEAELVHVEHAVGELVFLDAFHPAENGVRAAEFGGGL